MSGYIRFGLEENGEKSHKFNYTGWGNLFGHIGEIRISDVTRY